MIAFEIEIDVIVDDVDDEGSWNGKTERGDLDVYHLGGQKRRSC